MKDKTMPLKGKKPTARTASDNQSEPRENPEINAKIDAYMEQHPKLVERLEGYTKDRLIRMHVLNNVDREEAINKSIQNDWKNNPEKKEALATLVKHLPEEKREDAMVNLARQAKVQENRAMYSQQNDQSTAKKQSGGVGV